jgi:lipopolysaccharide export system permease protein
LKILDRYILSTYLKTFLSVFTILMFIFVLQTIWLYISELAGKDLDLIVIWKFLLYFSPKLVPLVLPLTILLASIMVFGNFAENYEFAAMKANGISLQRAMRGLSIFIVSLSILAFFFANNIIPWSEYESYNLRQNIAKLKPAMAIAEGQFNEIGNINIHVAEKSGDRGQYLKNVTIHQEKSFKRGNYTVIRAKEGELISSEDSNILSLELRDGNYYDELVSKNTRKYISKKPHAQSTFDTYVINVDLANLNNVDLDEKRSDSRYNMLPISGLNFTIDSLYKRREGDYEDLAKTLYNRSTFNALRNDINSKKDTVFKGNSILDLLPLSTKIQVLNSVSNTANSTIQVLSSSETNFETKKVWLNRHIISLHEKYVLGFACVILFFVGAPLGALIRKGGLGLPMVVAILLFLTYHFIGVFARNSAMDGTINPVIGTWLSTFIMLPLSIYLTYRATNDRGLFEIDFIVVPLKRLFRFKSKSDLEELQNVQSYSYYSKYSDEQLIEIVKNQNEFDLDKRPKQIALQHLTDRKIGLEQMEQQGLSIPEKLKQSKNQLNRFKRFSKIAFISYIVAAVCLALFFVLRNNKLPQVAEITKVISFAALMVFVIFAIVATVLHRKFYKTLEMPQKRLKPFLVLLGLPFYPIKYMFLNRKMKTDYHFVCLDEIN